MTVVVQSHVLVAELLDFEVVLVVLWTVSITKLGLRGGTSYEDVIGLLLVDCFVELDDL